MLQNLRVWDWRNHHHYDLPLAQTTALIGANGAGKTALLEALRVMSTGRSWRVTRGRDVLRTGAMQAQVDLQTDTDVFQALRTEKSLTFTRNGKKRSWTTHAGALPTVLFAPELTGLFHGTRELRLRWLDALCTQIRPGYSADLRQMKKVVLQKGQLLRGDLAPPLDLLAVYDQQLAEVSPRIWHARQQVLQQLEPGLGSHLARIAPTMPPVALVLQQKEREHQELFLDAVQRLQAREIAAQRVLVGPHRDDVSFVFRARDVRTTASRGEERSILLALLGAERDVLYATTQTRPVLLLDDVFSELDAARQQHLAQLTEGFQTLMTTTHASHLSGFPSRRVVQL